MAPPSEKSWIRHCNVDLCNVPTVVLLLQNDNNDDNCYGDPYAKSNYCRHNHYKGIWNNKVQGSYKISDLKMESDSDICDQLWIENFLGEEVSYPEGYAVADLIKFWTNYRCPRPNFFIFSQFLRKCGPIIGWRRRFGVGASISGKSWISRWYQSMLWPIRIFNTLRHKNDLSLRSVQDTVISYPKDVVRRE